ncbi:FMN-dependent NADH-azoreductase [Solibacillus sp. FSL W7-1472]|uniref:FMN dependent NADH:quinone oxidoreductase n=2 Tax=Solibacillus TaxID=648800 RepID=F2F6B6_SOLSS|nr:MULTISPECIES: FMN-dependent NADH-azoreductase [Solibacillus]AMO87158.1 FMN-dependent NADH-azoreductase [Solibacillus silvestris]EKB45242.1 FMN-dependent NADH-azoreductase 2 [Solibacillus isronensis B3W22]OBW59550.1 FMN-dependent NADH-azoreductase [Solibacillus silvestris]BAK14810.1 acyl carrier protein phosphodiesterase [Solibacillus silvestris StLB046]
MTNVLVVKANNRPDGVSTKMYETFIAEVANNEGLNVTTFDVFEENMPYFGQELFNAFGKAQAGEELSAIQEGSLAAFNKSREALTAADVVVFAFPLWNLTIPAALQSFIDYTYGAGYSFKYNEQGQLVSLMTDKKYIVLNARGGIYSTPQANASEMSVNYINAVIGGVYGMEKIDEVIIEGHASNPAGAEQIIADGLEKVKAAAQNLAKVTA